CTDDEPHRAGAAAGAGRRSQNGASARGAAGAAAARRGGQGWRSGRGGALHPALRETAFTLSADLVRGAGALSSRGAEEKAGKGLELRVKPAGVENARGIKRALERLMQAQRRRLKRRKGPGRFVRRATKRSI